MRRLPEKLKEVSAALCASLSLATDLAEAKAGIDKHRQKIDQLISLPPASPENLREGPAAESAPISRLAIWERTWKNGELFFVRPPDTDLWRFWADVEEIPPKRDDLRVVLLGESVARGFLLDPYFNIAKAIKELLNYSGHSDIELVDLARSAQTFAGLEGLLAPALALKPDAYILFAGNNWHIPQPELIDFPRLMQTLLENQSWKAIKDYFEELVKNQVTAFVQRLGRFSARHGIPIIFIIPEFNLKDWQPEYAWQNPLLVGELNLKRSQLISEAESALAEDDVEGATRCANELIGLDEGAHPAGLDLLAKCRLRLSDYEGARRLKEGARDLALVYPSLQAAHCYAVTQSALRDEGPANSITIIDLPQRFAELRPRELPDRHLFFDHVHMTVEGIRLTAACTAEKLLPLLGKPSVPWTELNTYEFQIDPYALALSHFGAACANGTKGQTEAVAYHCNEAVRHDRRIGDAMYAFLKIHRPNPIKYMKPFEDVLGHGGFRCLKFMMRPFANLTDRLLFPGLVRSIAAALSQNVPGIEQEIDAQLSREYGVTASGIDLLRGQYLDLTHAPLESQWWDENGFIRSYQREARFRFFYQEPCATRIRLTYRVASEKTIGKSVRIMINDTVLADLPAVTIWQTWEHTIPAKVLTAGMNSMTMYWPESCLSKDERLAELIKRLQSVALGASVKEVYSSYGEIFDIWVHALNGSVAVETVRG